MRAVKVDLSKLSSQHHPLLGTAGDKSEVLSASRSFLVPGGSSASIVGLTTPIQGAPTLLLAPRAPRAPRAPLSKNEKASICEGGQVALRVVVAFSPLVRRWVPELRREPNANALKVDLYPACCTAAQQQQTVHAAVVGRDEVWMRVEIGGCGGRCDCRRIGAGR